MFVDASALTAILAVWETVVAVARRLDLSVANAREAVRAYLDLPGIQVIAVAPEAALHAYDRFGKGRHSAGLNVGDCFAYACARTHRVPLLYTGNDFPLTDIEAG